VDVDFVWKSIKAIGQTAVKINAAAEWCVNVLDLVATQVSCVVQEAVVVMKVTLWSISAALHCWIVYLDAIDQAGIGLAFARREAIGMPCWPGFFPFLEAKAPFRSNIPLVPESWPFSNETRRSRTTITKITVLHFPINMLTTFICLRIFATSTLCSSLTGSYTPSLNAGYQGAPMRISFVLVTQIVFV